ncbi:MAG: alpha-amylase [Spirochaetae bacterium HGW-Spirochaetae-3]|nr:MAG: alpha-amylase [Spirochaetae bacterium HGW-Spirochaetae-3]
MATPDDRESIIRFESLKRLDRPGASPIVAARYEFHVSKAARDLYGLSGAPFSTTGGVVFADYAAARAFAARINERSPGGVTVKAGAINAMALIDELLHAVCELYRRSVEPAAFELALAKSKAIQGAAATRSSLVAFTKAFPPSTVYSGAETLESWLDGLSDGIGKGAVSLEELLLLRLANENPAFAPYRFLFDDAPLEAAAPVAATLDAAEAALSALPPFGPDAQGLPDLLRAPMRASPHSLAGQLAYMKRHWGLLIGDRMARLLGGVDMLGEDERPSFPPGPGPVRVPSYAAIDMEYERFSEDKDWMPRVVMMAKSALVWLDQLSRAYGRDIRTLDAIPDEELDLLASRGINALWLIGIWERSQASRRIKELCGNPEAAASAYSLFDYEIAWELGGWQALETLRNKALARGIRLAADMVPNHTGLDSAWIRDRPDLFVRRSEPPFPSYSYTGENLSGDGAIGLWIEDHYYDRRDAAVTFKRVDFRTGETSYVYHGNDGTSMPWNDTAQIDFLNPAARDAVKERILHVARNFPIIRFDAAMVLAKRSFRRLWYPEPGSGGAIASRFESAMSAEDFNARLPEEFWREVVDMCASEAPDTLLLAEAFWMMEGYFVRTLGMHRVYNSAFMNMLKEKKNAEYRATIKNTIEFDKDILKRFVNFMNNPDEDTAIAQFGSGDHYFGVCSMMATMPGLPMFGHGQFEGLTEKYGMEYRRAYKDERADEDLVRRHEREIVPLLKRRYLFSGVEDFLLYDLVRADGSVDENVFAYSNGHGGERAIVFFNNAWERTAGTVRRSCRFADKRPDGSRADATRSVAEGLGLRCGRGRYALVTETRSGLRYLRRSNELARDGLAVTLEGFQCQVFIDIHEIDDDEAGSYSALCDSLGGRGVPDIGWALQDLALGELYAAWTAAFGSGYFRGAGSPVPVAFAPDRAAVSAFLSVAARFAARGRPEETAAEAIPAERLATIADECLKIMERASSPALAARLESSPGAAQAFAGLVSLLPVARVAEAYAAPSKAGSLAESWGMRRKLREALVAAGHEPGSAETAAWFADVALGRLDVVSEVGLSSLASLTPKAVAEAIASDDDARALLGVNRWEDETWFDADRYGIAAALLAAAAVTIGGADDARVIKSLKSIDAAALAAGWSLDRMTAEPVSRPPKAAGPRESKRQVPKE